MRKILFRGFHECENGKSKVFVNGKWINGDWVYGDLLQEHRKSDNSVFDTETVYIHDYSFRNGDFVGSREKVTPSTVCQYTGLTDNNKNKAFKGDISIDSQMRKWVVFCCAGGFGICRDNEWAVTNGNPVIYVGLSDKQNASWFTADHKIIGNIHDNPILITQ